MTTMLAELYPAMGEVGRTLNGLALSRAASLPPTETAILWAEIGSAPGSDSNTAWAASAIKPLMTNIELYATQVIARIRELMAQPVRS